MTTVVVMDGDGIGPEISEAACRVLTATGAPLQFEHHLIGGKAEEKFSVLLPSTTLAAIKQHKVALKGPTYTPSGTGHRSINVELRERFDLYLNVLPLRTMP